MRVRCAMGQRRFFEGQKLIVLGFVTVDSESRRVFESWWDVPIVFSVADALYHPLKAFLELQNRVNIPARVRPQTDARNPRRRLQC